MTILPRLALAGLSALLFAVARPAGAETDYSYTAINGSTVQVTPYQKAINEGTATKLSFDEVVRNNVNAVVQIRAWTGAGVGEQGTGFYINGNIVLTCYHVVKNARRIYICDGRGLPFSTATLRNYDESCDVAGLNTARKHIGNCYLNPDTSWEKVGEDILTIGYPHGKFSERTGMVTVCWHEKTGRDTVSFEVSPDREEGASGSPVFNKYGSVIGILFANSVRNTSFAISMNVVWEALGVRNADHPDGFVTGITDGLDMRIKGREKVVNGGK